MIPGVPAGEGRSYIGGLDFRDDWPVGIMVRAFSLLAMGGGFLLISPKLREGLGGVMGAVTTNLNDYSPFSYIILAVGVIALMTMSLHNAATKR